jgi:predicted permease
MNPFVNAFLNVLTPIFIVAGLGYLAVRVGLLTDSRALSRVALYIFIPALTFSSLVKSKLPAEEFFILFFFAWIIAAAQGLFGWLIARGFSFDRLTQSAFLISIITLNAGNYGLPLNQFAYGAEGLTRATAYFIASSIVTQSLGVFIASRGTRNLRASVGQVFKMPLVYAALTGLIVNRTGVVVPDLIFRPLDLMAQAAVPTMLTLLGVELARARITRDQIALNLVVGMKLLAAPLMAFALAALLGLQGLTRNVAIVESSMPTAVMAALIAVEFDTLPALVSSAVLITTLGSVLTLTILLGILH